MTKYNTGNPVGSSDPRDLYDNATVIDEFATGDGDTATDRLGVTRRTIAGIEGDARDAIANAGYVFVGDYAAGIELTAYNEVVRDTSGEFWRVSGSTALPYTTTGAGVPEGGALVSVGDAALRQDLAAGVSSGQGALNVSGSVIYVDTIADLQALPVGELVDGQQVQVSGYYASGDGGGGPVRVWKTGAAGEYVDNGGSIIVPTGGDGSGAWVWGYSGAVNVKWFGAKGDGVVNSLGYGTGVGVDNKITIQACIDAGFSVLHGDGDAFRVDSTLQLRSDLIIKNIKFDFSEASTVVFTGTLFKAEGLESTPVSLNADLLASDVDVYLTSTADFTAGCYVYISSDELWDIGDDNAKMGEVHQVLSVQATHITLVTPIRYDMTVGNASKVSRVDYLQNIMLDNVTAVGKYDIDSRQFGAHFIRVANLVIKDCSFTHFNDRCFFLTRCFAPKFQGNLIGYCRRAGNAYGIQIGGATYYANISSNHFTKARHGVDFGDIDGVSRYAVVTGNTVDQCTAAGLSTHTAAQDVIIDGNTISCDKSGPSASGILSRSVDTTIANNRVINSENSPIYALIGPQFGGSITITSNTIEGVPTFIFGITVQGSLAGLANSAVVSNNIIKGSGLDNSSGILIRSQASRDIIGVTVDGNIISGCTTGIQLRTIDNRLLKNITITGNSFDTTSDQAIYLLNSDGGTIIDVISSGNNLTSDGPVSRGYREVETTGTIDNVIVTNNNLIVANTPITSVAVSSVIANNLV